MLQVGVTSGTEYYVLVHKYFPISFFYHKSNPDDLLNK